MRLQKRTIRQKFAGIQAVNRIGMGRIGSILKMLIIINENAKNADNYQCLY